MRRSTMSRATALVVGLVSVACLAGSTQAADLSKAKGTVDNIRQADPPQASTGTKTSPLGQSTTDYHPAGPSVKTKEPPSPVDKKNPTNDPDVQKGIDGYKRPK
jgi:hypothetical protein